ncbi:MAG: hypothetical protein C0432_02245 [Candidatus Puniceispirillum sp.]|nr:hypothetical protein [Candidatus Pelagibacter sp.]MBA4283096.1 hypothetical protein [Candidatus Puniceispirillum sp.]
MKIFTKWGLNSSRLLANTEEPKKNFLKNEIYSFLNDAYDFFTYQFKNFIFFQRFENIEVTIENDTMTFSHFRSNQILEQFVYQMDDCSHSDMMQKLNEFWKHKKNMYTQIFLKGEDLDFQLIKLGKIKGVQKKILTSQLVKSRFSPQEWISPLFIKYPKNNTQLLFVSLHPSQILTHHFLILKNLSIPISFVSSFDLKIAGEVCTLLKLDYLALKDIWVFLINRISSEVWQIYLMKNGAFYFIRTLHLKKNQIDHPQKFSDILDHVDASVKFAKRLDVNQEWKNCLLLCNFDENFDDIDCFESIKFFNKIQFVRTQVAVKKRNFLSVLKNCSSISDAVLYIKNYRIFSGLIHHQFKIFSLKKNLLIAKIFKGFFYVSIMLFFILLYLNFKDGLNIYFLQSSIKQIDQSLNAMQTQFEKEQQSNRPVVYDAFLKKYNPRDHVSKMVSKLINTLKNRFDIFDIGYSISHQLEKSQVSRELIFLISPKFFSYASDLDRQFDIIFNIIKKKFVSIGVSEKAISLIKIKADISQNKKFHSLKKERSFFKVSIVLPSN